MFFGGTSEFRVRIRIQRQILHDMIIFGGPKDDLENHINNDISVDTIVDHNSIDMIDL